MVIWNSSVLRATLPSVRAATLRTPDTEPLPMEEREMVPIPEEETRTRSPTETDSPLRLPETVSPLKSSTRQVSPAAVTRPTIWAVRSLGEQA